MMAMRRPRGRLFWKFFLSILLAQVAAAVGVGSVFWLREQARLNSAAAAIDTGPPAAFMLDSATVALKYGGVPALREILQQQNRHTVYVVDERGRELLGRAVSPAMRAQAERELGATRPYQPVRILRGLDGARLLAFVPRRTRGGAAVASPRPDEEPTRPPPALRDPADHGPAFKRGGPRFWPGWQFERPVPLLASVVVSLLFALMLAWYFSRPIRALRSAFEAAAAGDLSPRFTRHRGGDELSDLGRDFDRMSGQLRALVDGQRRLLHDVSHELRSPLARLQAAIGLAHQQPERLASSLARIERESVRMDKLVGELLTLSRLEAAPANTPDTARLEPVDVAELIDGIAGDARFEAGPDGAEIDLRVEGTDAPLVHGAPDLLWRAIENVVRNALKHGGAGGVIELLLQVEAESVRLEVADRGPGVPPRDLPAIFTPFFRSNPAANDVDGHGLGLAISQRVVQAHGGTIAARNREGGGLLVTIVLPRAGATEPA